jgi:DNA polymerase III epsilon subunit-like protein
MRLAKAVWPNLPGGYGLDNLIHHAALTPPTPDYGVIGGRHRAAFDTWMIAALLHALLSQDGMDWDRLLTTACLPDAVSAERHSAEQHSAERANGPADRTADDTQERLW